MRLPESIQLPWFLLNASKLFQSQLIYPVKGLLLRKTGIGEERKRKQAKLAQIQALTSLMACIFFASLSQLPSGSFFFKLSSPWSHLVTRELALSIHHSLMWSLWTVPLLDNTIPKTPPTILYPALNFAHGHILNLPSASSPSGCCHKASMPLDTGFPFRVTPQTTFIPDSLLLWQFLSSYCTCGVLSAPSLLPSHLTAVNP